MSHLVILTVNGKAIAIFWEKYLMQQIANLIEGITTEQANELGFAGETVGEWGEATLSAYELGVTFNQYEGKASGEYKEPF